MADIVYEPMIGEYLDTALRTMVALANEHEATVTGEFNGVTLTVRPGNDADALAAAWHAEQERKAAEWRASPEGQEAQRQFEEAQRIAQEAARQPLAMFSLKDADGWQRSIEANQDDYGAAVIRYAARWAALMERGLADGQTLADVAERTSRDADLEGISGFQYGCARSLLIQVWTHGDDLAAAASLI